MKGLIIKDIFCLKKQLTVFAYVVFGVFAVSVMYVISCKSGNLAVVGESLRTDTEASEYEITRIASILLLLFMALPIASTGDMINVFKEDGKAGFSRVAGGLPVPLAKRLISRYLTIFAIIAIGTAADILIAAVLSSLTDIMTFSEFMGVIISLASITSVYGAFAIMYCLILGRGREQYAQILTLISMLALYAILRFNKLKEIALTIARGGVSDNDMDIEYFWGFLTTMEKKPYILLCVALATIVISFFVSLCVSERKRGVI